MRTPAIRPRFSFELQGDADALLERVRAGFSDPARRTVCRVVGRHLDVTVVKEDRRRFSPCLSLEFEEAAGGVVRVRGLIGPHPNVWTFYALAAIALVSLFCVALIAAYAQHSVGQRPTVLYGAGVVGVLIVGLYGASQVGRRLASGQTRALMGMLEEIAGVGSVGRAGVV